jgi:hypothetical protein
MHAVTLKEAQLVSLIVDLIEAGEALNLANLIIEEGITPDLLATAISEVDFPNYEDPKEEALRSEQRISESDMSEALRYFNQATND